MSNAVAQSTSQLVASTTSIDNWDFDAAVRQYARNAGQIKGLVQDARVLKRNKLISGVCAVFRDHFPSLFSKRDERGNIIEDKIQRIPMEYYEKVVVAVDNYLDSTLAEMDKDTWTFRNYHSHRAPKSCFVGIKMLKSEYEIPWPQQLSSCHIAQGNCKRRLEDLDRKGQLTDELRDKIHKQLRDLEATEQNIRSHIPREVMDKLDKIKNDTTPGRID